MAKRLNGNRLIKLGAISFAFLIASLASAQQASDVRLSINLKDADMMTATKVLFQKTGVQFLVKPTTKAFSRITLKLDDVTAEQAVRYICTAAGAFFTRDDSGVFIISQDAPVEAAAPLVAPKPKNKVLKKIAVQHADVRDLYDQIVRNIPFDSTRGWKELKRIVALTRGDEDRIFGSGNVNVYANQSPTFDLNAQRSATTVNLPLAPQNGANDIQLPGDLANQGRGGGFGGQGGGGGLGGGGGIGGGQGGGGGLGGGGGQANLTAGQGLVPSGISFISYDPNTNSFIVEADDEEAINKLREAIQLFDVAPRQVQIKVEFITVTNGFSKNIGYEFQYQRGTVFAGSRPGVFAPSSSPVFLNYSTGNLAMRLRTSLSEDNSKVESAPLVRTLNNMPASITSQTSQTVFTPTTTLVGGAGATTSYTANDVSATTFLSVAPRINSDDTITVFLNPQIQGFVGNSVAPDGQTVPNTFSQSISVVARVKNNETIVLGGLASKTEASTIVKIPVLADLPIFGQFFRSTSKTRSNSELLIFVTPTIIEDESSNSGGPQ
jgi:type II secretory pathway component GspD/PulD (secretin)